MEYLLLDSVNAIRELHSRPKFPLVSLLGQLEALSKVFFLAFFYTIFLAIMALLMHISGNPVLFQVLSYIDAVPAVHRTILQFMVIFMLHSAILVSFDRGNRGFYYLFTLLMLIVLPIIFWSPLATLAAVAFVFVNYVFREVPNYPTGLL